MTAYMIFGVKKKVKSDTPANDVARIVAEATEDNMRTYQDELFPLMAFNIRCIAHTIPALTDFVSSLSKTELTPSRQHSLLLARSNALKTCMSAMLVFKAADIEWKNRRIVLEALADTVDGYAAMMKPDQRRSILTLADDLRGNVDPMILPWLEKVGNAMQRNDCKGLCRY